MSTTTFSDQLQDLWRTRPVRLPNRGPVAGVAAGIGYRYGVDPVLIRVAFVVATIFGGAGIVLYLAAWLLFPDARNMASPADSLFGRGGAPSSQTKTIVLVVAFIIALTTIGPLGIGMGGSGLVSTALMLGGWWLLYQRRPLPPPLPVGMSGPVSYPAFGSWQSTMSPVDPSRTEPYGPYTRLPDHYEPEPTPATGTEPSAATTKTSGTPGPSGTSATPGTLAGMAQPPSWDPLGVAPFAWDLPEPRSTQAPAKQNKPRSRLTTTVLGLAILAAAAAGGAAALGADWFTPGRIGAVALAVIGVGLIIGAFLRRGYGLLVVTAPLLGFVILASLVHPLDMHSTGHQTWTPTTMSALAPSYEVHFGDGTLDLRNLDLTADKTVDITNEFGSTTVLVPDEMNVNNHCQIEFGTCPPEGIDGGTNGTDGPVLNLNIDGRFGSVEVHRG
jgi:phage shock protein PspC (stress-responsive transcriptional regulator)